MYADEIEKLNGWFDYMEETNSFGIYRHTKESDGEDLYVVNSQYMEDFTDYLREEITDLIGFKCMVGTDGIWFTSKDLDNAYKL